MSTTEHAPPCEGCGEPADRRVEVVDPGAEIDVCERCEKTMRATVVAEVRRYV